jgi:hypothetical protein
MKKAIVGVLVMCVLSVVACKKKDEAMAAGGAIGVAECDEYIAKYQKCIDKMPAAAQTTAQAGFKAQQDAWKASASTPEGKAALKTGCKATLEALSSNALCK